MMDRIEGVAEPDVNVFNVALPEKARLDVFERFCPLDAAQAEVKINTSKRRALNRKRKQQVAREMRTYGDHERFDWDEEDHFVYEDEFTYQPRRTDYFSPRSYRKYSNRYAVEASEFNIYGQPMFE